MKIPPRCVFKSRLSFQVFTFILVIVFSAVAESGQWQVGLGSAAHADGYWAPIAVEAAGTSTASGYWSRSNNNFQLNSVNQPWRGIPYGVWSDDTELPGGTGASVQGSGYGGAVSANANGQVRTVFRWVTTTGAPVPPFLTYRLSVWGSALTYSQNSRVTSGGRELFHDTAKEHLSLSVFGVSGTIGTGVTSAGPSTFIATGELKRLYRVATNGQNEVAGPWVTLNGSASVDGGRIWEYV